MNTNSTPAIFPVALFITLVVAVLMPAAHAGESWHLDATATLLTDSERIDQSGLQMPRGSRVMTDRKETLASAYGGAFTLRAMYPLTAAVSVVFGAGQRAASDIDMEGSYAFSNGDVVDSFPQSIDDVRSSQAMLGLLHTAQLSHAVALELQADLRYRDAATYQYVAAIPVFGVPGGVRKVEDSAKGIGLHGALTQRLHDRVWVVLGADVALVGDYTVWTAEAGLRWRAF